MFNAKTEDEAVTIKGRIISDYSDAAEAAMQCLDEGFESSMTVMRLPAGLRKYYRTSNHIERLNKELKRRSKVIRVFPDEKSTYQQLISSDLRSELKAIADNQRGMLAA